MPPTFNHHNKKEFPPMHTAEHVFNATMCRLFGCGRSVVAHIERKKSKLDFTLLEAPTQEQIATLEEEINKILRQDLTISYEVISQEQARLEGIDLSRLPEGASDAVRVVRIGSYDSCLCLGDHVDRTSQCGTLHLTSHDYDTETQRWRVRFKLEGVDPVYR